MSVRNMFDDMVDVASQLVLKWERLATILFICRIIFSVIAYEDLDRATESIQLMISQPYPGRNLSMRYVVPVRCH